VSWHEKLQHYEEAIEEYNKAGAGDRDMVAKIKCFNEMGDWKFVLEHCSKIKGEKQKEVADLAVNANINLGRWEQAKEWVGDVDSSNENLSFWNAILSLKN
jgi:tetratricopeptide (TPR) repeat protein